MTAGEATHDPSGDSNDARLEQRLGAAFHARFQGVPTHVARAPGRVNLIGEHTDYNGLPVFPMAIQRRVSIAFRARADGRLEIANLEGRFAPRSFEVEEHIEPYAAGDWGNYVKAAAQELRARFGIRSGIDALVVGDIPAAAGLSSSSALVVAATLALVSANELEVPRETLMELTARGERFVGVQSGGMDQAISLGGLRGHAVVIDFDPIRLRPTRVPADWRFVIANSFVSAEKSAGHARQAYNERVAECRAALEVITAQPEAARLPKTYYGLVHALDARRLLEIAERALTDRLLRRFRHEITEFQRVEGAREAMLASDSARFGSLMDAAHESLRYDYEVSCPELDSLVAVARAAGAHGARLTGAGFGGSIVALTTAAEAEIVVERIQSAYHAPRALRGCDAVFVAEPSAGAELCAWSEGTRPALGSNLPLPR